MKQLLTSAIGICLSCLAYAQGSFPPSLQLHSSHHVPVEKHLPETWTKSLYSNERKIYKGNELETIGMPCGGIAAGQLYVRGDGTLANWWIANNAYNTGYGIDSLTSFNTVLGPWEVCYKTFRPASYIDQGFTLRVKQNNQEYTANLDRNDFDDISFIGEYPIARISYGSTRKKLPVKVDAEIFSPFIPLDARSSATPGTILKYTLKNISSSTLTASLQGWLQNWVCLEIAKEIRGQNRNRVIRGKEATSVVMDLVESGVSESGRYFPSKHPYFGNMALTVVSPAATADADYAGATDGQRQDSAKKQPGDKLLGAVGTTITLKPGESREVLFFLTWYFPNRPSYYGGSDVTDVLPSGWNEALPTKHVTSLGYNRFNNWTILGNMYSNWFDHSLDVANWLRKNYASLSAQTHLFHDTYYDNTTLPYWLVQRLLMPLSTLATETCQWWANGKFWAWEGVGSCVGTCTHVWNYEQALAHFFPELERNIRERTDFDISFGSDGGIQARNGWGNVLIDGHAGAILKAYREHLKSKDYLFVHRYWDRIKRATLYLVNHDINNDGLIESRQPNTYDIAFYGANTYVGSLYLAALKAAARMAAIVGDNDFERSCDSLAIAGRENTVKRLWNGEYFIQDVNLNMHPEFQYGPGCLSDQLFGQTWSHLLNTGYIYPPENVKKTLQSVWAYNWAPDVGTQNRVHPPERIYASFGEAGLLVATWPHSPHLGEKGVRYRDEVWTGIEYQVATNMIYDGMINEGLSIVKAVHDRYDGARHNPWNEVECGDHYARALASWGVMLAVEDYYYNGPDGILGFNPRIMADNFTGFFTAAEGWGNISQKKTATGRLQTVKLAWGELTLRSLQFNAGQKPSGVTLTINQKQIPAGFDFSNGKINIRFNEIKMEAGQELSVQIRD